jgi:RNA recognition motif-containing protein
MRIYIGNLPYGVSERELRDLIITRANVTPERITLPRDRENGRGRGFGFVEIDDTSAAWVIEVLSGCELEGRLLRANEARPNADHAQHDYNRESARHARPGARRWN